MKKFTLIIFLTFAGSSLFSQDDLFLKIKKQLIEQHPEVVIENKLVIVSFWSVASATSREANIQMDKAVSTYKNAKLKGGNKGVVGVLICLDENKTSGTVALGKDKINNLVSLEAIVTSEIAGNNYVYDSKGVSVSQNLKPEAINNFIHQLVTR